MKHRISPRRLLRFSLHIFIAFVLFAQMIQPAAFKVFAQSRRQPPAAQQKKNKRPDETKQGDNKDEETPQDVVNKPQDAETITITSSLVNVDAVVYNKKTGQIITGLKKDNFTLFVDGERRDITNFSTPDAPLTVTMLLEYSRLLEGYRGDRFNPQHYEVLRPMVMFLSQFVKPPDDFISVVAYDMRPTTLTDFTNDPTRIRQVIDLLLRNQPSFSEANLFDALKFTLIGGRGDSVVLENSKAEKADYAGLSALKGRRTALVLVCSGIDTFSKINYDQARKVVQNAGVPIYIIGTGNLFFKQHGDDLDSNDGLLGQPGRMTFYQAQNTLKTFAKETGGEYFPVTFDGELPKVLGNINALLRNQYSLGFNPGEQRDGKQHKLLVKVDVDGDGKPDDKDFVVKSRPFYNAPKS